MGVEDEFFERLSKIKPWRKGDIRAPHKPLYMLFLIGALQHGHPRLIPYVAVDHELGSALRRFAPRGKQGAVHPEYPFWRLQKDGLAEVNPINGYEFRKGNSDPKKSSLVDLNASGGFATRYFAFLRDNPVAQTRAVHQILDTHFPRSIHEDIVDHFRIQLGQAQWNNTSGEFDFRARVLEAYNWTCAVTGYRLVVRNTFPGLEAAHLCWPRANANDDVTNGIALTTLHRKLFHLGLFAIDPDDYCILLASEIVENDPSATLREVAGRRIHLPREASKAPSRDGLTWHFHHVFRG